MVARPETPKHDASTLTDLGESSDQVDEITLMGKRYPFLLTVGSMLRVEEELGQDPLSAMQALEGVEKLSLAAFYPIIAIVLAGVRTFDPSITKEEIMNRLDFPVGVMEAFELVLRKVQLFGTLMESIDSIGPSKDQVDEMLGEARKEVSS